MSLKKITLETTLKPFCFDMTDAGFAARVKKIFTQWENLWANGEKVELLIFSSDGSELLEYEGDLDAKLEYGCYLGVANHRPEVEDPTRLTLFDRCRYFMENPPRWTYGDLKRLTTVAKKVFQEMYGRPVELGTLFDPGPEFAVSDFKYGRHAELMGCMKEFVCCYGVLKEDHYRYAAYPDGIPDGTPFGTFLGRQANAFLREIGFDYLWFSNGFGFGMESWGTTGVLFNGKEYHPENAAATREKLLGFWKCFRKECPDTRVECRGTNLTTGIDLSSDGVPLRDIYREVPGIEAPPNSPWAALDSNFGLELAGMMSHVAELPKDGGYPFRYYTHDPWWLNSPWLDRYGRMPHDIYLPLACARITENGKMEGPSRLSLLSIDNSMGEIPDQVPDEVIPYLQDAFRTLPDQPGPLVWVYPFDEYHDAVAQGRDLPELFSCDWQIVDAINDGLPLNTVVSTANLQKQQPQNFAGRVLIVPTLVSDAMLAWLKTYAEYFGSVVFYGSAENPAIREIFGLEEAAPLQGDMLLSGIGSVRLNPVWDCGPLNLKLREDSSAQVLHEFVQNGEHRPAMLRKNRLFWIRPVNSYSGIGVYPTPFDPMKYTGTVRLFREAAAAVGWTFRYNKFDESVPSPRLTVRVHDNAFYYAGFGTDSTVMQELATPDGVPVFVDRDVLFRNGRGVSAVEKWSNLETRLFVTQNEDGPVRCKREPAENLGLRGRLSLKGLKNATVVFRPQSQDSDYVVFRNFFLPQETVREPSRYPYEKSCDVFGVKYTVRNVTGLLTIAWGMPQQEFFPPALNRKK